MRAISGNGTPRSAAWNRGSDGVTLGRTSLDYTIGVELVRSRRDGTESFYHTDGLGSTRMLTDTTGLVTDRYVYDAYGVSLSQTGTSGNAYQFAGEQRDVQTGLDYLRARYYDPNLGRFISKDPFSGFLTDPMSQHDYQYAHANPVNFTDPTGYFTLADAVTTISLMGIGASVWSSVGYVGYGYLNGNISDEEVYGLYGQWAAGFADGVSGGISTDVLRVATGKVVQPKNDFLWRMGQVAGISTAFLIGFRVPVNYTATIGQAQWLATWQVVTDGYGAGKGIAGLIDGQWEHNDVWNTLSLLPFAGATLGAVKGVASAKGANAGGVNGVFRELTETRVVTGSCFVAGTEILTTEGEKNIEDIQVGDWVIADDPTTEGEIEARQVLDTFVRHSDKLVDLYVDGEVITTTGEHPFWVPDNGWVEAEDLQVGSLLQTENGVIVDVDRVERRSGSFTG